MVEERGGRLASEQTRDADLPAGRREQILTANHQVDLLTEIVDGHGELIRPVAQTIADQYIAALQRRILLLQSQSLVDERLDPGIHAHAPADPVGDGQAAIATASIVSKFRDLASLEPRFSILDLFARAVAAVDKPLPRERRNGFLIDV